MNTIPTLPPLPSHELAAIEAELGKLPPSIPWSGRLNGEAVSGHWMSGALIIDDNQDAPTIKTPNIINALYPPYIFKPYAPKIPAVGGFSMSIEGAKFKAAFDKLAETLGFRVDGDEIKGIAG